MPKPIKNFLIIAAVLFGIAVVASLASNTSEKPQDASINTMISEINNSAVKSIDIDSDVMTVTLRDEKAKKQIVKKEIGQSFSSLMDNYGVPKDKMLGIDVTVKTDTGWKFWLGSSELCWRLDLYGFLFDSGILHFVHIKVGADNL
jgi:ATP-dependent Zn protease